MIFNRGPKIPNIQYNRVKIFNNTYFELLEIMKKYSDYNPKFYLFYNNNKLIRNTTPEVFINIWYNYITKKYYDEIMNEDIEFFMSRDYENIVPKVQYIEYNVNTALQFMKNIYPVLDEKTKDDIKLKVFKLTKLSYVYNKNK